MAVPAGMTAALTYSASTEGIRLPPPTGRPPNGGVLGGASHRTGPLSSPLHYMEVHINPHDYALPQGTALLPHPRPSAS